MEAHLDVVLHSSLFLSIVSCHIAMAPWFSCEKGRGGGDSCWHFRFYAFSFLVY